MSKKYDFLQEMKWPISILFNEGETKVTFSESFYTEEFSCIIIKLAILYEPCHDKICLRGFRPGPTQIMLFIHSSWLEA